MAGDPMPRPYVVKPYNEGSSVGVNIIKPGDNAKPFAGIDWPYGDVCPGRNASFPAVSSPAASWATKPMAVTELRPKSGFYDYANKYTDGFTDHLIPAPLAGRCLCRSASAWRLSHIRQSVAAASSRCDFRYDDTRKGGIDEVYLLEINTQPGFTALSLVPEMARYADISYPKLVSWMVEQAQCDA